MAAHNSCDTVIHILISNMRLCIWGTNNPYNRGGLQRERDEAGQGKQYEGGCGKQDKDKGNEKDKRMRTSSRKGRKGQWMTRKVE